MKRIIYILSLMLALAACEVIPEGERFIPVPYDTEAPVERAHLLIDYTGFRCVNCPTAAETAHAMQALYGELLVVVAMHPASNPFTQGKYDYTCPEADDCYRYMGGTAATPFPTGNIDIMASETGWFVEPAEWAARFNSLRQSTDVPVLSVEAEEDSPDGPVTVTVTTFAGRTTDCRLAIWLTEDSVPGVQAMPDGSVDMHYCHRHMLRSAASDGVWGSPVTVEASEHRHTLSLTVPDGCDRHRCAVVALLLDAADRHVLQVKQTSIQLQQ